MAATDVESKGQTEIIEVKNAEQEIRFENRREENLEEVESTEEELNKEFKEENQEKELSRREESLVNELPSLPQLDEQKLKELVSTEINLEKQLESVQKQLLALKQLPSEIENHLRIVSEQLYKIMELSGMRNGREESCCRCLKGKSIHKIKLLNVKCCLS